MAEAGLAPPSCRPPARMSTLLLASPPAPQYGLHLTLRSWGEAGTNRTGEQLHGHAGGSQIIYSDVLLEKVGDNVISPT